MHPPENIELQEENENGSVWMKLKRHLVIEFGLKGVSAIISGQLRSSCYYGNKFKSYHSDHIQGNQR